MQDMNGQKNADNEYLRQHPSQYFGLSRAKSTNPYQALPCKMSSAKSIIILVHYRGYTPFRGEPRKILCVIFHLTLPIVVLQEVSFLVRAEYETTIPFRD